MFMGMTMPRMAMIAGGLLAAWGIAAYIISDMSSITAMIPAFFGAPISAMGMLSEKKPESRKHFMHVAAAFGLLSALGGARLFTMLGGEMNLVFYSHVMLLVVGGVFTFACVRSFMHARASAES